jgi:hypothetical protein
MEFATAWGINPVPFVLWCKQGKKRTANKADGTSA